MAKVLVLHSFRFEEQMLQQGEPAELPDWVVGELIRDGFVRELPNESEEAAEPAGAEKEESEPPSSAGRDADRPAPATDSDAARAAPPAAANREKTPGLQAGVNRSTHKQPLPPV